MDSIKFLLTISTDYEELFLKIKITNEMLRKFYKKIKLIYSVS